MHMLPLFHFFNLHVVSLYFIEVSFSFYSQLVGCGSSGFPEVYEENERPSGSFPPCFGGFPFRSGGSQWRLNESLLSDQCWCEDIWMSLHHYFQDNLRDDIYPVSVWAAHKATVHGKIIQTSFQLNRA